MPGKPQLRTIPQSPVYKTLNNPFTPLFPQQLLPWDPAPAVPSRRNPASVSASRTPNRCSQNPSSGGPPGPVTSRGALPQPTPLGIPRRILVPRVMGSVTLQSQGTRAYRNQESEALHHFHLDPKWPISPSHPIQLRGRRIQLPAPSPQTGLKLAPGVAPPRKAPKMRALPAQVVVAALALGDTILSSRTLEPLPESPLPQPDVR